MIAPALKKTFPLITAFLLVALCIVLPWTLHLRAKSEMQVLRISTGQAGGVYQPLSEGIAQVISADHPRLRFEQLPSEGSLESMRRLEARECELALLQNGTPGGENVRVIAPLYLEVLHILVDADAPQQTITDLAGLRIAIGPEGSGTLQLVKPLFAHYGIDSGEFEPSFMDIDKACSALLKNDVDAVFVVAGIYAPTVRDTLATGKTRLISIGVPGEIGGEVEGMQLHDPNVRPFIIPRYTYRNADNNAAGHPRDPVQTIAVRSLLVCRSDLNQQTIRTITRSIFDNRVILTRTHVAASQIKEPEDATQLSYPLHPGAERYYRRHEPGFLVQYAEVIALIMSLFVTGMGTLLAVRKWIDRQQKDRIDKHLAHLDTVLERLHSGTLNREELADIERELTGLRHDALRQLVREKIQADAAFQIFQTLLANSQQEVREQVRRLETATSKIAEATTDAPIPSASETDL
jgi:TRAP transporter TAXI family solute receptor